MIIPEFKDEPEIVPKELRLGIDIPFGGLNLRDVEMKIGDGQSPAMQNVNLDDRGAITKRRGQTWVLPESHGEGKINGLYEELFYGKIVYAWQTSLYAYDISTGTDSLIAIGLTDAEGNFFVFNDVLHYKNGTDYKLIDSSFIVKDITTDAYIPTLTIGRSPSGGGTVYEQFNLVQPKFIDSFNADGTSAYTLSLSGLDATPVIASTDGGATWDKIEGTHFTVDRSTGVVTWNSAPTAGTNNVKIQAAKTVSGMEQKIKGCIYSDLFGGGSQDSRIFTAGDTNYKNAYYYTGLTGNPATDATYWPENNFNRIGSDAKRSLGGQNCILGCWQ